MRIVVVERSAHSGDVLRTRDGARSLPWSSVVESLDRHDIPDGRPFIVDDDGSLIGCDRLNTYLLTAWHQRAYDLDSIRSFHAYHLARLLRFVRARHGECVDLTATDTASTEDLTAYQDGPPAGSLRHHAGESHWKSRRHIRPAVSAADVVTKIQPH